MTSKEKMDKYLEEGKFKKDCDYEVENDGIGSYECHGYKGYDSGHDYVMGYVFFRIQLDKFKELFPEFFTNPEDKSNILFEDFWLEYTKDVDPWEFFNQSDCWGQDVEIREEDEYFAWFNKENDGNTFVEFGVAYSATPPYNDEPDEYDDYEHDNDICDELYSPEY